MKVGKYIYGIVPADQEKEQDTSRLPCRIKVDLYMREFALPEDLSQIPRHGADGSYAVISIRRSRPGHHMIRITAIKVINGEERAIFMDHADTEDAEDCRRLLSKFDKFAGYLPLVGHHFAGPTLRKLQEAYGVQLGKALSNTIIDTERMAANHMPQMRGKSLEEIAEEIGIVPTGDTQEEKRCRMIWELYRRMDHSELEKGPHAVQKTTSLLIPA